MAVTYEDIVKKTLSIMKEIYCLPSQPVFDHINKIITEEPNCLLQDIKHLSAQINIIFFVKSWPFKKIVACVYNVYLALQMDDHGKFRDNRHMCIVHLLIELH